MFIFVTGTWTQYNEIQAHLKLTHHTVNQLQIIPSQHQMQKFRLKQPVDEPDIDSHKWHLVF